MKLRVVGWVAPYATTEEGTVSWAARNAIIDELRKHGYIFSGPSHNDESGCTPVLNNGKKYLFSTRGWGDVMAEAQGYTGSMDYMRFYMPLDDEVYPDTNRNEFDYVTVEDMDEMLSFFYEDMDEEYRDDLLNTSKFLTPETDLNERIELEAGKDILDSALNECKIVVPVAPELRYLDAGDTLALICDGTVTEFTVFEVVRKRALSEQKLKELIDATYDFKNRERAKKAQDEIDASPFVLHIKLKKVGT